MAALGANAQVPTYSVTGIATQWGAGTKGGVDTIDLTPCAGVDYSAGAAWSSEKVDFKKCFTIEFDAMFNSIADGGGDGICVVFGSLLSATTLPNGWGGYLGYYNNPTSPTTDQADYQKSVAVEIDNFDDDPAYPVLHDGPWTGNHTQLSRDASAKSLLGSLNGYTYASVNDHVNTSPTSTTIMDGNFHHYKVEWVPTTTGHGLFTFTSYYPTVASVRFTQEFDYGATLIHPGAINWGFTGGCAAACSHQEITNIKLTHACRVKDTSGCDDQCYWTLHGNTINPLEFIGTLNNQPFRMVTNSTEWAIIDRQGEIGMHIPAPQTTLDVDGTPMYGAPSGIRFRNLPAGGGLPIVVGPDGSLYVGQFPKCCDSAVNDTATTTNLSRVVHSQADQINLLQSQVNELTQQISDLKAMFSVNNANGNSFTVTPNPTSGQATVHYTIGNPYVSAVLKVTDATGRTILTKSVSGSSGDQQLSISPDVASGQLMVILFIDGKVSATQKLILLNK